MNQITAQDLRSLLGAAAILNENLEISTLPQRTVAAVTHVLSTDIVTYNDVDLVRHVDRIFVAPGDVRLAPGSRGYAAFMRHIHEHPLIAHNARVADPVPRKISDFLSRKQFRSLGLYYEFFRGFSVNYQVALVMRHAGKQMIGIAANRTLSDFTERERACLAVLRSHVVQSYRNGLSVERVRATAGVAGRPAVDDLTQREAEVLHWVAGGKSNDDVARILGITSATVKKHLERIYAKLAVPNRTAAGALYMRLQRTHVNASIV